MGLLSAKSAQRRDDIGTPDVRMARSRFTDPGPWNRVGAVIVANNVVRTLPAAQTTTGSSSSRVPPTT